MKRGKQPGYTKAARAMLSEGPVLTADVALELRIPMRIASSVMCRLYRIGVVDRKPFKVSRQGKGPRTVHLWTLVSEVGRE